MQRITTLLLICLIIGPLTWLFTSAISMVPETQYSPPPREAAPRVYANSHKVKFKRTKCSLCHIDPHPIFIKRVEGM